MSTTAETLPGNRVPNATPHAVWPTRAIPLAAGLVQGVTFLWLWASPPSDDPLHIIVASFALSATFVVQMTWPGAAAGPAGDWRSLGVALSVALILTLCQYWAIGAWEDADMAPAPVLLILALLLSIPLLQGFVTEGLRVPGYARLFGRATDAALAVLIGLFCVAVVFLLLQLWVALFRLLGFHDVARLLSDERVPSIVLPLAWTLGILATREHGKILDRLLRLCSALARGLLPIIVLIGGSFFLSLPFAGLGPVWATGGSALLLTIAAAGAILVNGVYQAGGEHCAGWQKRLTEATVAIIAIAVGLAAYGSIVRVWHYGLTPPRVLLLAGVITAALVAAGYGGAALWRRGPWLAGVGHVNRLALPMVVLLLIALTSPVLDPVAMSASSQYRRLAAQIVPAENFDFGYLRFRLGPAGQERLAALERLDDHPDIAAIRSLADAARHTPNYEEWRWLHPTPAPAPSDAAPAAPNASTPVHPSEAAPEPLERAASVSGPIALTADVKWQSGAKPRLYVVTAGHVEFRRDGRAPSSARYAAVFRAEPDETIVLMPADRAAVLIVELDPPQ